MSGLYKVVLNGAFEGVQINNILWYRSNVEAGTGYVGDLVINSAEAIANSVKNHIWEDHMRQEMPSGYTLATIDVYPYNNVFELIYTLPFSLSVQDQGTVTNQNTLPPACSANLRFNLRPNLIDIPGFPAPKRGWVKLAPIQEQYVGNDGLLNETGLIAYGAIATALGEWLPWDFVDVDLPLTGWDVTVGIPMAFAPLRARVWTFSTPQIIGGVTFGRYINTAEVLDCAPAAQTGYARSRRVEA